MSPIKRRIRWISENGIWKLYGVAREVGDVEVIEVRIMKLGKNGHYAFYFEKNIPFYVLKERDFMYAELR